MKAFILVALVASVAARGLDLETLRQVRQEKTLLNTPVVSRQLTDDLLLKEQQLKQNVVIGQENLIDSTVLPLDKNVEGIYNYDNVVDADRVLSFQELYNTPMFQEYLSLPLFRQYIQYPSFQRFVGSVYFQRFYQLSAYKQYFVNPVLFYKYIYPIVQLFNTEYNLPTVYGQQQDVLGLQSLVDDVLLKNRNYLPYAYNYNRFALPTTSFTGTTTNYKFLLEKLYKSLYANQPIVGDYTQVKTDVKLIPEKVVVEPITNKVVVEEPRILDVQVEQQIAPVDTIVPITTEKLFDTVVLTETDVLLLKELLRQNIITPEVFQTIVSGKVNYATFLRQVILRREIPTELLSQVIARLQVVDTVVPVTTDSVVLTKRNLVILRDLFQRNIINQEVYQAVLVGRIEFPTVLRQVLERRGINADLINLIINRLVVVDTVVPVTTEQDVLLLKELLRQNIISQEVYQTVLVGKFDIFSVLRQVIITRDVVETVVPFTTDSVVLTQRHIVILRDLLQKNIITPEVYQAVVVGQIDFATVIRQVLVRRGITVDLINQIVNRLVVVDSVVPVTTEQDVLLLKELLRQNIITPEVYQTVLVGKVDFFTILRQVILRRDVIDTIVPVVDTVVLTERHIVLLKDLLRQNIISQEIYQAVILGKVDFVTIIRQVLERRGLTTDLINLIINRLVVVDSVAQVATQQDVYLLKGLLRQNLITYEIYQAVLYGRFDIYTVLRQIVLRGAVVDTAVFPYSGINRYAQSDRYNYVNNIFGGYKTEYPTIRNNIYNRFPIVA